MIYAGIVVLGILFWVVRRSRTAHLGNDVLKFQLFQWLRHRNMREARSEFSYEHLERKLWWQVSILIACEFACITLSLKVMGLSLIYSSMISLVPTVTSLTMWLKYSRTYRHITLPLFATLCRMPQSHWDMTKTPRLWVRTDLKAGRVWIRLPKDWHANKRQLDLISDLVESRLPGQWHMTADTRKFLLTFKQESQAETVPVPNPRKPAIDDAFDFVVEDKEIDNGPW